MTTNPTSSIPEDWITNAGSCLPSDASGDLVLQVKGAVDQNIIPDATTQTTEKIDYKQLANEHSELLTQGKTSVEIAHWIGNKLNIPSWEAGEFYGERKVLSSPKTPEETARLSKFVEALGVSWTKANQSSANHPQYLLLDGNVQNALFGQTNMAQVDARLYTFYFHWQKMWNDFTTKAKYLLGKIGLDIKDDWSKLTGIRNANGDAYSDGLYAFGALDGDFVRELLLDRFSSNVSTMFASNACLCFLA